MYDILDKFSTNIRPCNLADINCTEFHFVYCIINKINKKFYIGKHSTKNLNDNYLGSGYHITNSVLKYGPENFVYFPFKFFNTSEEAYEYEKFIITEDMVKSNECFNWKGGGDGFGDYNTNPAVISSKNGTNPWIGENNPTYTFTKEVRQKIKNHPNVIKNQNRWKEDPPTPQRIKNGTHNMLTNNPNKNIVPWKHSTLINKPYILYLWSISDEVYEIFSSDTKIGCKKLYRILSEKYPIFKENLHKNSTFTILNKFKTGWIPIQDKEWNLFKQEYSNNLNKE